MVTCAMLSRNDTVKHDRPLKVMLIDVNFVPGRELVMRHMTRGEAVSSRPGILLCD